MKRLSTKKRNLVAALLISATLAGAALGLVWRNVGIANVGASDGQNNHSEIDRAIETALYTRAEFFGAQAIVPFPTAEARARLAALAEKYPNEAKIRLRLAQLDERLNDYEKAEAEFNSFVELSRQNPKSLEILAAYFHRRARFSDEAATLERILKTAAGDDRREVFARIIELAKTHRLENYLKPGFYRQIVAQDPADFVVVEQLIDKLTEEKSSAEALDIIRQNRGKLPEREDSLLGKEIELLLAAERDREAEAIYHKAFNPFWTDEQARKYYRFLDEQNRFRAYRNELRERVKRNPAESDAAIRLFHYEKYNGSYLPQILINLEKTRAEKKIKWQPEELLTVSRLLLSVGDGDAASRFLYTLFAQNRLEPGSALRRKVLYQLFAVLSDAGGEQLSLAKGSLDFYRDIGAADPHPGITTGILSLIFSDINPAQELKKKEATAARLFNRAAAFRVFTAFREENPAAPELAQMYLDLVRLYLATGERDVAARMLAEFEARREFQNAPEYAQIALKLADAFVAAKQPVKERGVYARLLDYLGSRQIAKKLLLVPASGDSEPTQTKPVVADFPYKSNSGINVLLNRPQSESYYGSEAPYADFIGRKSEAITYAEVLNRYVASLARENRTGEILGLYAAQTAKYPNESGLDEQMLQWLGQTNLADEQLKIYRRAIEKFPSADWQDRLARWFLRQKRQQDFARFSESLLARFDDERTQKYFAQFIDAGVYAKPETFDAKLYLALYTKAHERFPHNQNFVRGLLDFYQKHNRQDEWRRLTAEYYFESAEVREIFLNDLAKRGELRIFQAEAAAKLDAKPDGGVAALPYKQFRADAAVRLSNYEAAVDAYRELNRLYPNQPEYAERLIALTRSFGQINRQALGEAAALSHARAENEPAITAYRTRAGEIQAELGNYNGAREEWRKLIETGRGDPAVFLETATVFWDYFQYTDALKTIQTLRAEKRDARLYAFETGALLEAKRDLPGALAEYARALDGSDGYAEDIAASDRAKRRLETLYGRAGVPEQLQTAFAAERRARNSPAEIARLVLGYADFLRRVKQWEAAKTILRAEIARSDSTAFLEEARDLCETVEDKETEKIVLNRLASVAANPRAQIKYRLQLAESFSRENKLTEAAGVLSALVAKFPTNYGVLSESADFSWRIGDRERALQILQSAMERGHGEYRVTFGRKLAARLQEQKRDARAEAVLTKLYNEDALNYGVYRELANLYVRTGNREKLGENFNRTLAEIKNQNVGFRELDENVAELRKTMINAFTRLKDYSAAVNQHIEIINREPENQANIEAAIGYVRRYGGADALADYYQKTAQSAYKNYRWFVILARVNEAKNDLPAAAENYKIAVQNQPEMIELHDALAQIYEKQNNYEAAIAVRRKTLELSGDEPTRVRQFVKLLEKAGRQAEADAARQKLPAEKPSQQTLAEQFAAAERLKNTERAKALEIYRAAFDAFAANPLAHNIKTAEIVGYAGALRGTEPLDQTASRFWNLRDKLVRESERLTTLDAAKLRGQIGILDNATVEAIGGAARDFAFGNERDAVFAELEKRIESAALASDANNTLALLQNVSAKAGFGALEEKILIKQKDVAFRLKNAEPYHARINALLGFYRERGDFTKVSDVLETERKRDFSPQKFDYLGLIAENARLLGNREQELAALREHFRRECENCPAAQPDARVGRYFEALAENGETGRAELQNLADAPHDFKIQLINFLLARGERELARRAIEHSGFKAVWKLSRQAETSLALGELADENQNYFRRALQLKSIGELTGEKPDENRLDGGEWFALSHKYGKWLFAGKREKSEKFLPATLESRPQDANAQAQLGRWYLERKDAARAIEHLRIALEMKPGNKRAIADFGAAHLLAGDEAEAFEIWAQIISAAEPTGEDFALYLETLGKSGRAAQARQKLAPVLTKHLTDSSFDEDETKAEIRLLAASFGDNRDASAADAQAEFFRQIAEQTQENLLLPETLVSESLVARNRFPAFYEMLVERSEAASGSDYSFADLLKSGLSEPEAEAALDAQTEYEPEEPEGDRLDWQKQYLNYLLEERQTAAAERLAAAIEKSIERRFARPAWLRLARLRAELQTGKAAATLPEFKRFVGAVDSREADKIIQPNSERLSDAANLLRAENQNALAVELQTAVYARLLALEQLDAATFGALATIAFERGDAALGSKLLEIMVDSSVAEKRDAAAAELSELDLIKAYSVDRTKTEDVEPSNSLSQSEALKIAAEIWAKFERRDRAIECRQQLAAIAPNDAGNRIELARLFARQQNANAAAENFAAVIKSREASRKSRWLAAWTAAETFGSDAGGWNLLKTAVPDLNQSDNELQLALEALERMKTDRAAEAVALLNGNSSIRKSGNLQFLAGLAGARTGRNKVALGYFLETIGIDKTPEIAAAVGSKDGETLRQIVRLYLDNQQPHAAFKLIENNQNLADKDLLKVLSHEAVILGDFKRAAAFESQLKTLLSNAEEQRAADERIEVLRRRETENANRPATDFAVNQNNVSE